MSLLRGLFALTLIAGIYTFGPIKIVGFKDYSVEAASAPQQALPPLLITSPRPRCLNHPANRKPRNPRQHLKSQLRLTPRGSRPHGATG
jgi:hypothetical protein